MVFLLCITCTGGTALLTYNGTSIEVKANDSIRYHGKSGWVVCLKDEAEGLDSPVASVLINWIVWESVQEGVYWDREAGEWKELTRKKKWGGRMDLSASQLKNVVSLNRMSDGVKKARSERPPSKSADGTFKLRLVQEKDAA